MYQENHEELVNTPESATTPEPTEESASIPTATEESFEVEPEKAPEIEEKPDHEPVPEAIETEDGAVTEIENPEVETVTETEIDAKEEAETELIQEAVIEPEAEIPTKTEDFYKDSIDFEEIVLFSEGDIPDDDEELVGEYTDEERRAMLERMEETMAELKDGELIKGKILRISADEVVVDIGFKSEGIVSKGEFIDEINVGDEIEVFLEQLEDEHGQVVVSKRKADFMRVWNQIKEAYEDGSLVQGIVRRRIKGGMVVDMMGVDAFLPGSQVALRQVPDFDELIGEQMEFRVIKLNKIRRNIVVSRRAVLEDERSERRKDLLSEIEEGQIRTGVVKNITDFGVFIDLGGLDGLLHITDMSWTRIKHPSEMVNIGDETEVKILKYDDKKERISLGLKQLTESPWEKVEEKFPEGSRIRGKVVNITKYGAFIELEEGIEGLVHVSEMSWTKHINHPSEVFSLDEEIDVIVLSVDKESQKISLGIKQLEPDPWTMLSTKYPPGSKIVGKVRNLTSFGAFIEIEEGIDGLIHISDMSWTKRIMHPSEALHKNEEVEVVVLNIDAENRRVSLGLKQVERDPWPDLEGRYSPGRETEGRIVRMTDRGVTVKLPDDVEGFVPVTQLGKEVNRPHEAFSDSDLLPLKVIEFDITEHRIVLSVNAFFDSKEQGDLDSFLTAHPTKTVTMREVLGESFDSFESADTEPEEIVVEEDADEIEEPEEVVVEEAAVEIEEPEEVVVEEAAVEIEEPEEVVVEEAADEIEEPGEVVVEEAADEIEEPEEVVVEEAADEIEEPEEVVVEEAVDEIEEPEEVVAEEAADEIEEPEEVVVEEAADEVEEPEEVVVEEAADEIEEPEEVVVEEAADEVEEPEEVVVEEAADEIEEPGEIVVEEEEDK